MLVNVGRGDDAEERTGWGRIITIVRRFWEASPPNTDLGACPLNYLNLFMIKQHNSGIFLHNSLQLGQPSW